MITKAVKVIIVMTKKGMIMIVMMTMKTMMTKMEITALSMMTMEDTILVMEMFQIMYIQTTKKPA